MFQILFTLLLVGSILGSALLWALSLRRRSRQVDALVHEWEPLKDHVLRQRRLKPDGARNKRRRRKRRGVPRHLSRLQRKAIRRTRRQSKKADRWKFQ